MHPAVRQVVLFGGRWSPARLFAPGDVGAWYDPSDLSTLWQDTAGTTPVTADGDSVARINDKSGGGRHLIQSSGPSMAKFKTDGSLRWLLFDGTDDGYATASTVDFSASDEMSVCAGAFKASDAAIGVLVETSASAGANNGAFNMLAPRLTSGGQFSFLSRGTANADAIVVNSAFDAPKTAVLTGMADISGDFSRLRANGAQQAQSAVDQGTGNYGNYTLYAGRRNNASLPFNGRLYSLIIRNRLFSDAETASVEAYTAAKSGITL